MKKPQPKDTARIFWDRFGISACECPKCDNYQPNVEIGAIIKCPVCSHEYKVIE